jgi:hypothetical protein
MKNRLRRIEQTAILLILTLGVFLISISPRVSASIAITQVTPPSGPVGTSVQVIGNLTTANGSFNLLFDSTIVATGTAVANNVTATFTVPQSVEGNHYLQLADLTTNETTRVIFLVSTTYSIGAVTAAKSFQEGDQIPVILNITGGTANSTYGANITAVAPDGTAFSANSTVVVSAVGSGTATANYPADFSVGANTKYMGLYSLSFNSTLASGNFTVQLTNFSQYHRGETVDIKALYLPDENVTVSIVGKGVNNIVTVSDPTGLISYDWTVPSYVSIGSYAVSVVSTVGPTVKSVSDSQNFTVPGFAINVTAKNLANETVSGIVLNALENGTLADNETTSSVGLANMTLEVGNYDIAAFSSGVKVGETSVLVEIENVTFAFDVVCNLTDLRVHVVSILNGAEVDVPQVDILLGPSNKTYTTDINGSAVANSLLPGSTYTLNVTRYSASFNLTTLNGLLVDGVPVAFFDLKIDCPNSTLQVTVLKADGGSFSGASVKIRELLGVPIIETVTDSNGVATFDAPFGKYTVDVFDESGNRLNGTEVGLLGNQTGIQTANVTCSLYGLAVSVKVVDYLGQGMANMDVSLVRNGRSEGEGTTGSDGTVTFDNVVGGLLDIVVTTKGGSTSVATQSVDVESLTSTNVIRVGKYVMFAGMLVETSELAAIVLVILVVVLLLFLELYRRRHVRASKTESESSDK